MIAAILVIAVSLGTTNAIRVFDREDLPNPVALTGCGTCNEIEGLFWQHYFPGGGCAGGAVDNCYDCNVFNTCHSNIQSGYCGSYHYGCEGGGKSMSIPQVRELERVVAAGDGGRLAAFVTSFATSLHVNRMRRSLQVEGCDGSIVANYPLGDTAFAGLVTSIEGDGASNTRG